MKKLIMGLILLFATGCNFEYNLVIDSNKKITEEFVVYLDRADYSSDKKELKQQIEKNIKSYKDTSAFKIYDFNYKIGKEKVKVTLSHTYDDFAEYKASKLYKEIFYDIYQVEGNGVFMSTSGKMTSLNSANSPDPEFYVPEYNISIKFHNKVTSSNATSVDEAKNVYTWKLDPDDENQYIEFKISNDKRYDIIVLDYIMNNIFVVVPVALIASLVLVFAIYVGFKQRLNNRI